MDEKQQIKDQFGTHAVSYITSKPHAKGASLSRLVELVQPQADWEVLDIATAVGHTAFAFAPHVKHVWATDITPEMLEQAQRLAADRGITNVTIEHADADNLPYDNGRFQLVTCRIAPHHFSDVPHFVREATRVLCSGGILAIVDNIVPTGTGGDYINAYEKLRDPSHGRCLNLDEWQDAFIQSGLTILQQEQIEKPMHFESWAARHNTTMQRFLRAMLSEVTGTAATFLHPEFTADQTTFYLRELILIGQKA